MIVVTGTGRSGTSAVTGALSKYGFTLALEQELIKGNWTNEKGNYEPESVKTFNESVLKSITGSKHDWDFYEVPEASELSKKKYGEKIRAFVSQIKNGSVIKDPRFTFTLPIWRSFANIEAIVYIFRHPHAVASSLMVRDGTPKDVGIEMWIHWVRAFEQHTNLAETILVDYDSFLEWPEENLDFIAQQLTGTKKNSDKKSLSDFLDKSLNHHPGSGMLTDSTDDALHIYNNLLSESLLQRESGYVVSGKHGDISMLNDAMEMTKERRLELLSRWVAGSTLLWRGSCDKENICDTMSQIANMESSLEDYKIIKADRENRIEHLLKSLSSKDKTIGNLKKIIAKMEINNGR